MAPSPTVSVVIPCYEQAQFLREAIDSVVAQTFTDWEIVVVNDGSPDDTVDVARAAIADYPERNIRLLDLPNRGVSIARNAGIAVSRGRYILPLDADDMIRPDMLAKTVALLDSHADVGIAYTDLEHFGCLEKVEAAAEYDFDSLVNENQLNYCSLYRREAWEAVGGYALMSWGYEDWEFWIACGERGFFGKRVPEPLLLYRVREGSMYTSALDHEAELRAEVVCYHPGLYGKETVRWAREACTALRRDAPKARPAGDGPLVSVVVQASGEPASAGASSPALAIRSVMNQTHRNAEIIVVDHGGPGNGGKRGVGRKVTAGDRQAAQETRDTVTALNRLDNITYVVPGEEWAARGRYVVYLDEGQVFRPDHIERLVAQAAREKSRGYAPGKPEALWPARRPGSPAVSVIIPCYKQAQFLREAIDSVVAQTYEDWEIVVVDDGSPDDAVAVAEAAMGAHTERDIRLLSTPNRGLAPALNAGIAASHGRYILPLSADDLIRPEMLEKTHALLEADADVAIAYTDVEHFGCVEKIEAAADYDFGYLLTDNQLNYCALYRREAWESAGGYAAITWGYEDWEFWITCGEQGFRARRIPEPLFLYRVRENSMYTDALARDAELRAEIVCLHPRLYSEEASHWAREAVVALRRDEPKAFPAEDGPLVSVVIRTCDRPASLALAIRSVLSQTYRNVEIIVVNDAGPDVRELVTALNRRGNITYVAHPERRGAAAASNTGVRTARGKYIAYLDDDDVFYPDHVETLVEFLEGSEYRIAYADANRAYQVERDGRLVVAGKDEPWRTDFDADELLAGNYFPVIAVMHERSVADEVGPFDETLTSHDDWDMWIRVSRRMPPARIPKATCEFRWRPGSDSMTHARADFLRTMQLIHKRYREFAADKPGVLERQRRHVEWLKRQVAMAEERPEGMRVLVLLPGLTPAEGPSEMAAMPEPEPSAVEAVLPALGELRHRYPDAEITALCLMGQADVLAGGGALVDVLLTTPDEGTAWPDYLELAPHYDAFYDLSRVMAMPYYHGWEREAAFSHAVGADAR